ncbi:MAG: VWA domain-containing protein [Actinomycetota bacterium]
MKFFFTIALILLSSVFIFAQKQAEVIVTSTYLRKAPDYGAEKIQTLQKSDRVTLEKSREASGWYYVSIANGTIKGWILTSTVRPLKNEVKVEQTPKPASPTVIASPTTTKSIPTPKPIPSPTPTPAAETVEDTEVVKIDTEEVSLSVRVVDRNNRPVNKLRESDFKVYEDDVQQPITSLTTAEVPIINALLIDNSRSLRTQLKKVIEASKIIVGTNRTNDETSVVRFISSNKIEVVQDFTADKTRLNNALDNLFVDGGQTAIIDAVYRAAKMVGEYQNSGKKEDVKLRALILVSDGDDRASSYQEKQLFELLRNSSVQIYAIGFINNLSPQPEAETNISRQEKAKSFLTRLAQETGGKVYFPDSIDELPKIAAEISGELRTQYYISYSPTNDKHDGSFRKIKVEIADGTNNEKRNAITRTGRNTPTNK